MSRLISVAVWVYLWARFAALMFIVAILVGIGIVALSWYSFERGGYGLRGRALP